MRHNLRRKLGDVKLSLQKRLSQNMTMAVWDAMEEADVGKYLIVCFPFISSHVCGRLCKDDRRPIIWSFNPYLIWQARIFSARWSYHWDHVFNRSVKECFGRICSRPHLHPHPHRHPHEIRNLDLNPHLLWTLLSVICTGNFSPSLRPWAQNTENSQGSLSLPTRWPSERMSCSGTSVEHHEWAAIHFSPSQWDQNECWF